MDDIDEVNISNLKELSEISIKCKSSKANSLSSTHIHANIRFGDVEGEAIFFFLLLHTTQPQQQNTNLNTAKNTKWHSKQLILQVMAAC